MNSNYDLIIEAGIKSEISRRMGFDVSKVILLESTERGGRPVSVSFEVCGQGYTWNVEQDAFFVDNSYGDAVFGE